MLNSIFFLLVESFLPTYGMRVRPIAPLHGNRTRDRTEEFQQYCQSQHGDSINGGAGPLKDALDAMRKDSTLPGSNVCVCQVTDVCKKAGEIGCGSNRSEHKKFTLEEWEGAKNDERPQCVEDPCHASPLSPAQIKYDTPHHRWICECKGAQQYCKSSRSPCPYTDGLDFTKQFTTDCETCGCFEDGETPFKKWPEVHQAVCDERGAPGNPPKFDIVASEAAGKLTCKCPVEHANFETESGEDSGAMLLDFTPLTCPKCKCLDLGSLCEAKAARLEKWQLFYSELKCRCPPHTSADGENHVHINTFNPRLCKDCTCMGGLPTCKLPDSAYASTEIAASRWLLGPRTVAWEPGKFSSDEHGDSIMYEDDEGAFVWVLEDVARWACADGYIPPPGKDNQVAATCLETGEFLSPPPTCQVEIACPELCGECVEPAERSRLVRKEATNAAKLCRTCVSGLYAEPGPRTLPGSCPSQISRLTGRWNAPENSNGRVLQYEVSPGTEANAVELVVYKMKGKGQDRATEEDRRSVRETLVCNGEQKNKRGNVVSLKIQNQSISNFMLCTGTVTYEHQRTWFGALKDQSTEQDFEMLVYGAEGDAPHVLLRLTAHETEQAWMHLTRAD